jgi:hypothetical protein
MIESLLLLHSRNSRRFSASSFLIKIKNFRNLETLFPIIKKRFSKLKFEIFASSIKLKLLERAEQ